MEAEEAFREFELAVEEARHSSEGRERMVEALLTSVQKSGKTKKDLIDAGFTGRATIERWFAGRVIPNQSLMRVLREFLLPKPLAGVGALLADVLTSGNKRIVLQYCMERIERGEKVDAEEIEHLFWLADKKKVLTLEGLSELLDA